jgi:hypothetical protein
VKAGDVVWIVDIAEPHPVRGVVAGMPRGSVMMRLDSGSLLIQRCTGPHTTVDAQGRTGLYATVEEARAAGRLAFDRMIAVRRDVIAAAEQDIADLERQRDGYGGMAHAGD